MFSSDCIPSLRSMQMWRPSLFLLWLLWRVHLRQCLTGRSALAPLIFSLVPAFWLHDCTVILCVLGKNALSSFFLFFSIRRKESLHTHLCVHCSFGFCLMTLIPNCGEVLHQHSVSILCPRLTLPSQYVVVNGENICKTFSAWCTVNCVFCKLTK